MWRTGSVLLFLVVATARGNSARPRKFSPRAAVRRLRVRGAGAFGLVYRLAKGETGTLTKSGTDTFGAPWSDRVLG